MNGDPQKRKVLYEALTKDGYDLGTYEEYSAKLDDPTKVRALYDGIKGKYDVGDFEVFSAKVGPSFQQPLKSMTTPAGAASGGSMLSATGSAGSVAAPSPSPEPQGPPTSPAFTPQALTQGLAKQIEETGIKPPMPELQTAGIGDIAGQVDKLVTGSYRPKGLLTDEQRTQLFKERDLAQKTAVTYGDESLFKPRRQVDQAKLDRVAAIDSILAEDAQVDAIGHNRAKELYLGIEGEKTRGRIAPLMFASPEGQQALRKISEEYEQAYSQAIRPSQQMQYGVPMDPDLDLVATGFRQAPAEVQPVQQNVFYNNQGFVPDPSLDPSAAPQDPRDQKILMDFDRIAPKIGQRLTQFGPNERRERKEVGAWTSKQEGEYRAAAYEFQSRLLHGDLLRITEAIKSGADPAEFRDRLMDIQAGIDYIADRYKNLAEYDRPTFRDKVLAYQQTMTDIDPDGTLGPSRPGPKTRAFIYGGTKAMATALGGAARLLDKKDGYTPLTAVSDWSAEMAKTRDADIPTSLRESTLGSLLDGAGAMTVYILSAAPGGIAGEVAAANKLAGLASAAGRIGTASAVGTMYAAEYEGFVRQAMEQGAPKEVAESGANIYTPLATAIEFFNPQLYLAGRKAAMEPVKKQFMSLIKEGMAPRTAMKTAMELADAGTREAIEELGQTLTERGVNMASNALAGTELNTDISSKEAAETALVSFILGGAASGVNLAATRKERQAQRTKANVEAMHWAMQNPKEAEELIAKVDISEEEKVKAIEKVQRMASIFKGNNLKEKDPEVATNVVEAVAEKKDIEQDIKENPVDPPIEAAVGDPRKREVAEITKEIMSLMEIPQDRARAALAGMGMERVEEKVVKQPDGSVVLESKEPKTEEDEVDAILDEEFAAEPEAAVPGGLPEVPARTPEATTAIETPQGTGVEVEVGPTGAVTPEATSTVAPPAPEAVAPEAPVAQKPKGGKKAVAQAAPAAPTAEPVTSITEVKKSKDGSQVEYKVPGWEDLRIVVQREKGGYAANIMVGDQALKIQPKGKEEGTAKLAILDAKERLDRAGREKISALISSATPKEQRPANREEPKTPIGDTKTVVVDGKERTVFNSDGRPIHPTVEGVRNFWRWFGDSKVVDDQGRPLVVYHGTKASFDVFDIAGRGKTEGAGAFFTSSPDVASTYSGVSGKANILPVYLRLSSPLIASANGASWGDISKARVLTYDGKSTPWTIEQLFGYANSFTDKLGRKLGQTGYDSAILNDLYDMGARVVPKATRNALKSPSNIYIVKDPLQVKSVTGNAGYFTNEDASIVAQRPQDGITPSETAIDRIDNVVKALRSIVPDLAVIVHDTPEEFAAESRRAGGRGIASDAAFYDPKTNAIHLNRQMASDNTLFHEAAHPILLAVLQNNSELFLSLYKQLATDPAFAKYIEFGESYSDKDELTRAAESLAEFMADVAAGKVQFSKEPGSLWQKFVEWLQELMAKVGLDFRAIDLSNPQNVRDFAAKFARGVREGIELRGLAEVRRSDALPMLQEDAQAVVDGWYSRLDQAVAAKGSTMPGSQWGKWLEARAKEGMLSMEEAKWTGLSDWLAGKSNEKVTPQQVREFLKENRVKVEVKELDDESSAVNRINRAISGTGYYFDQSNTSIGQDGSYIGPNGPVSFDDLPDNVQSIVIENDNEGRAAKFSQYQLHGGTNYREVLVTLPAKEMPDVTELPDGYSIEDKTNKWSNEWRVTLPSGNQISANSEADAIKLAIGHYNRNKERAGSQFTSSHFDEPNILVHLRLNDRTGPNGEKVLFIEELQSDWGQQGKKKGFKNETLKRELDAKYERGGRLTDEETEAYNKQVNDAIHSAPFVTSTEGWVELGLKQAIRMAVEGGYDRIAWTTGEQQNERYDLSKQVDSIAWKASDEGKVVTVSAPQGDYGLIVNENGIVHDTVEDGAFEDAAKGKRLDEVVGKDMADKIMSEESGDLSGEGLKIGGSGMKGFYDKILPTTAKKVAKKLGGDGAVSDVVIGKDQQVGDQVGRQQSIAITPEMRQRVSMGVPMMQRPKAIPVDRWNAMVPTIREALKAGMKPKEVMSVLRERKLLKGVGGVKIATLHAQIKSAYGKIAAIKSGRNRKDPNDPWRIRAEGIDENAVVDKRISEDDSKKLAEAEKLRKSIKKGLKKGAQKRRDVYLNELAKDFTSLRIPKTALDDYISMATAIKDLIRGASVAVRKQSVDALRTDAGVTNEQIEQYIQEQQQAQQPLDEQEMLEEFVQKRIKMGLEGASLTLDDIRSLMNSFAAEEQQQEALEAKMKAEQKLQMLRTMSRLKLEELSEHLKSQELDKDKKQIVANLKLIDLDRISAKDAVFLIGMVNNIVKNDRWGGARTFSEEVGSSERAIALMQEFAAMRKKLPKPKAARNATEQVVMMMRRFFGEYSDKIAEASGMDGILNASAQANRMAEEIHKARDKYAKSVGYKDTELNRYRAQAYAYLQSVEGDTQEQQQASFEKLRNDLLESARMLMDPTRDTHRVKFPDLYIQAVAEVAEPARSLDEVKVAEPIRKMVEWEQQQHAKDYAMHAQAAELDHNKRMGYVRAYTARGYFETDRFTETQQNRDPSILERFFDGTTVKERLAGSKMDRVGRRPSQIVDLDFFSVQDSARRELYMDTFGARYIARMRGVLTDPRLFEGDNPVMTRATRDIMTQRVRSLIKADQVVADVFSDKWTKAYNKVSRRASAIALVGSGAFIKQLTPLVSTFFHVRPSELVQGMRDATQTHREGTWQNNIAKTQTIYERAQVMAGLERIGETVARKAVLRGDESRAMELSKLLYTEAGHLSNEYGRRTIAFGDAWAATATWWAFYRQYIRKAGLENTNWKAELNEQAAAYASDREQFMQGANIPEANAPMYRNVKLFQRVVLDIFFSFNSFNLNNLNRMSHDIKDIRFGSPEARKRGYIDLTARLFEMAAFRATADALRIYATLFLADLILEAIGDDPKDDRARRAAADAKKYDYWVRLLADVGMDFAFTGMGDIPTNVVKDGFNTIVNLAEEDTGPKKRNYDLYYVSDKDSYGVLGILYGQASNLFKAAEVMSKYKGVEGKEAKRMRDEAMILAALSVAHLAGYTDQTITRGLEREIVRRLPYQIMHKREERFGQVLGKALYDLIDQDEPYTPSDTYENY